MLNNTVVGCFSNIMLEMLLNILHVTLKIYAWNSQERLQCTFEKAGLREVLNGDCLMATAMKTEAEV